MAEVKPAELLTSDPSSATASNSEHERNSINTTEIKFKESNKTRKKKSKVKSEHRHSNSANNPILTENKCSKLKSEQAVLFGTSTKEMYNGGHGRDSKYERKHDMDMSADNSNMKSTLKKPNGTDVDSMGNEDHGDEDVSRIGLKKKHKKSKKKKKHKEDIEI